MPKKSKQPSKSIPLKRSPSTLRAGLDLSPNHGIVVASVGQFVGYDLKAGVLVTGSRTGFHQMRMDAGIRDDTHPVLRYAGALRRPDPKASSVARHAVACNTVHRFLTATLGWLAEGSYTAVLEGYANHSPFRAHECGAVGGIARALLMQTATAIVLVPPKVLKKLHAGNGNADKRMMREATDLTEWPAISEMSKTLQKDFVDALALMTTDFTEAKVDTIHALELRNPQ